MIRKRGARWQVRVYVGRDLLTGRKRYTTATVSTRSEAKRLEARLVTEIDQGRHRAGSKTVGELVEHRAPTCSATSRTPRCRCGPTT